MKTLKISMGIIILSLMVISCKNEVQPETKTVEIEQTSMVKEMDENAVIAKAEFNIDGMSCAIGCARIIEKNLNEMEGVKTAKVDFDKKMAMVEYDEAKVNTNSLEATVTNTSDKYSVNNMKTVESFTSNFAKKKECSEAERAKCKAKKGVKASLEANTAKKECDKECDKSCCAEKA
jgi:Cu+-exporting ATPase